MLYLLLFGKIVLQFEEPSSLSLIIDKLFSWRRLQSNWTFYIFQWLGQFILLSVHLTVKIFGQRWPNNHLHYSSAVGSIVWDVWPAVHPGRGTVCLPRFHPAVGTLPVSSGPGLSFLSQSGLLHYRGILMISTVWSHSVVYWFYKNSNKKLNKI